MLFNTVLMGLLVALMNTKFSALEAKFEARFARIEARLDALDKRFDDMRDLWRAELHRVEEVLDARLKHLESR